ncbi:MAG: photosystem II complex extrinsic protein PsbU [Cyanobacteria bacterium J06641_5]
MRGLVRLLAAIILAAACSIGSGVAPAIAFGYHPPLLGADIEFKYRNAADDKIDEIGDKIDLNNAAIRDFRELRGFFPNLAASIIQNAPYDTVKDVLKIPDISDRQRERLQENIDRFVVTEPSYVFNDGDNRYNTGIYN